MQLRRLEAFGFKSFADKLDIEFDKGITAIVGPNGSGKSNITDAIRWVLGEQNVRNLRGNKTEDIIFTGSATRRALGVAEVSLTIDNHDGKLPVAFEEVVITRRLFRSGESEFYINKTRCRLKDIYDLFSDTGLGRDAISVISQNKIDQVLNSRPEERRILFEEAAGITKYRNRKRESLKKLEDTEQNVLRVNDILQEIENQLGPLAESAEKTRRYNGLYEEYRCCKINLLLNSHEEQKIKLKESNMQKAECKRENDDSEVKINLLEVEKERLNNELLEVEKSLQLLNDKNHDLSEKIEKNNTDIALYQERLRQSNEQGRRLDDLQKKLIQTKSEIEHNLQSIDVEIASAAKKTLALEKSFLGLNEKERQVTVEIRRQENVLAEMKEKTFHQAQTLLQKKNDIVVHQRDIAENERQSREYEAERLLLADRRKERFSSLQALRREVARLKESGEQVTYDKALLAEEMRQAHQAQRDVLEEVQQLSQRLNTEKTRLRFLQGMQEEYEGFGRGVKRVLKNDLPWHSGVCGAVAEIVKMDAQYVTALEIALGGSLQNVVTENDDVAKSAIAFLKREKLGRVTFLPLNTIRESGKRYQEGGIERLPGIIGYANSLVQCEDKYRNVIDFLLSKTIVADQIDTALLFAKSRNYRVRVVTLEGELLSPGGALTGGGNARRETSFFNRAGEIASLHKAIEKEEADLLSLQEETKRVELSVKQLDEQWHQLNDNEQKVSICFAQQNIYLEKEEKAYRDEEDDDNVLVEKINVCRRKAEHLVVLLAEAQAEIDLLDHAEHQQKDDDREIVESLRNLRAAKEANDAAIVDCRIQKTIVAQEKIRVNESKENLRQMLQKNDDEFCDLHNEVEKMNGDLLRTKEMLAKVGAENERLMSLKSIGVKDHDHFRQVRLEKLATMQKQEQELKNLRKKFNDQQAKLHQADILITQIGFALESCVTSMQEEYHMSIEAAARLRLPESPTVIERKIVGLEREMTAMGAVNPNAIAEYEALNSRYGFIKAQLDDLIVAKEYLSGIIKEIDVTMSKQFAEAFAQIGAYFGEIFVRLFGGGEAKLELNNADQILESGIEISVRPPNKKTQNLSVLSGGERALTVIALLFSFLKFRPAPFSVVDEIDAPLDEANVDRFGAFLKEYAQNTQFIVVTHRKGTMQVADVMHGVTVEDSGISKIISVKLENQMN